MKKIVYIGGMRSMIVYLFYNIKYLKNTIFLFENDYKLNLKNKYILDNSGNKDIKRYRNYKYLNQITSRDEEKEFWIQDHLNYSPYFLVKFKNINLLEDGLDNYNSKLIKKKIRYNLKNKLLGGTFKLDRSTYGISKSISKIYLTGMREIPEEIREKVELINLKKLWEKMSEEEKKEILKVFNIRKEEMEIFKKRRIILITQTISEDTQITEEEKIDIYRKILSKYNENEILIKPHPREVTDYKKYFKNIEILRREIPMEMISFLVENLEEVITLFSTSAFEFKDVCKVKFLGTEYDERLVKNYGIIK